MNPASKNDRTIRATELVLPANTKQGPVFYFSDQLHALSPKLLLQSTPLLSWTAKFRALLEMFRGPHSKTEPSMTEVMSHRFGPAIVDNFVAPMCAGIYASPPENISVPAAFPRFWSQLQRGSLLRQMVLRLISKSPAPRLTSFDGGSVQLCDAIAALLQENGQTIHLSTGYIHRVHRG